MAYITPLILDFVNFRTPELRRSPESRDPDGATLDLWLKYEGMKKFRWRGRASMDAGRLAEALATIKDDGPVTLRLPYNWIPVARHPVLAEDAIGEHVVGALSELFEAAKQAGPLSTRTISIQIQQQALPHGSPGPQARSRRLYDIRTTNTGPA